MVQQGLDGEQTGFREELWGRPVDHIRAEDEKTVMERTGMLIPSPKATCQSMNLISFDPAGTFRFADCIF
ncbi:MAG: hypothetical protein EOM34_05790 [Clostridia bacterium]|nr:hypothetical protein [Lachnospiraceae bacterium]NCC00174.1 hypothetical protein [Clostridia bacterium]NCD03403.1 hypothetical protein [Clostridia bacterium]